MTSNDIQTKIRRAEEVLKRYEVDKSLTYIMNEISFMSPSDMQGIAWSKDEGEDGRRFFRCSFDLNGSKFEIVESDKIRPMEPREPWFASVTLTVDGHVALRTKMSIESGDSSDYRVEVYSSWVKSLKAGPWMQQLKDLRASRDLRIAAEKSREALEAQKVQAEAIDLSEY